MKPERSIPAVKGIPHSDAIVDHSVIVGGLIGRILDRDPALRVVVSVESGQTARGVLERQEIDVVVLDITMPVMDSKGHLKRDGGSRERLTATIKALGARCRRVGRRGTPGFSTVAPGTPSFPAEDARVKVRAPFPMHPSSKIVLKEPSNEIPRGLLATGSSTGRAQALSAVVSHLSPDSLTQPILITQHMPATGTVFLAKYLARVSGWAATEVKDGDVSRGKRVYIAPGDFHMIAESKGNGIVQCLTKTPQENFCRQSVDPVVRSVVQVWRKNALVCILTGMGYDGVKGSQAIVSAGGTVIAQDEATSVVWEMSRAVATDGLCSDVLSAPEIAPYLQKRMTKRS